MPVVSGSSSARRTTSSPTRDQADDLLGLVGAAFDKSMLAMLLVDDDNVVRCANVVATEMLGGAMLVGRSIADLCCRQTAPRANLTTLRQHDDRPEGVETWATIIADSGERIVVMMRWHAVLGKSGTRYHLVQLWDLKPAFWHFAADLPQQMSAFLLDGDLRIVQVVGKSTGSGRYDGDGLPGRLMSDILPSGALHALEQRYRQALAGHSSTFDYSSPVDAANYQVSVRPVIAHSGEILGILAIFEDVTADRVRRNMLEQVHQLSRLGSCSYSITDGWIVGRDMLQLLGVDSAADALSAMDSLVEADDRERARSSYRQVIREGGRATLQYRIRHGRTGELRHMAGAIEAAVDSQGTLMRALLTLADVTEAVEAEMMKAAAAQGRTLLMRRISDALTMPTNDSGQLMQTIADVVATALGDCAVLRVLTPDAQAVETELVSAGDDTTGVAQRVAECLLDPVRRSGPGIGDIPHSDGSDELWSSIDNADWHTSFEKRMGYPVHERIHHFISAPIRHEGALLGFLRVFRFDAGSPYQTGDDDVLQILADRIGAAIAERRFRELLEQQQTQALVIADRLNELTAEQRELLEQLAGVEERERTLLAEAIHDGPMQTVVAVMMRMENFSILGAPLDMPEVASLVDTLETSVQRLRTLIIALTPPDLRGGLRAALDTLAQGIFIGTGTQITTSGPAHVALTPLRKGNAHRILREALVNARKHAQAQHVSIELEQTDTMVVARIIDDGVGSTVFDAGPGHLGMVTMRARAGAEGGRLDIESTPGKGTTISLSLPINATPGEMSAMMDGDWSG